jgi:sulfur relay (sulfurtransferase) DsrF/TusC family protein
MLGGIFLSWQTLEVLFHGEHVLQMLGGGANGRIDVRDFCLRENVVALYGIKRVFLGPLLKANFPLR